MYRAYDDTFGRGFDSHRLHHLRYVNIEVIKEFFKNVQISRKIGFLAENQKLPSEQTQTLQQLFSVIGKTEGINRKDLYLDEGVLVEDTESFLSAQIFLLSSEFTRYIFFNDHQNEIGILTKIEERCLDNIERMFIREGGDSRDIKNLRTNQLITDDGFFAEAEYIAFLVDDIWYKHKDMEGPLRFSYSIEEDIIEV